MGKRDAVIILPTNLEKGMIWSIHISLEKEVDNYFIKDKTDISGGVHSGLYESCP